MRHTWCRGLAAATAAVSVLGACTIEQDLAPRIDVLADADAAAGTTSDETATDADPADPAEQPSSGPTDGVGAADEVPGDGTSSEPPEEASDADPDGTDTGVDTDAGSSTGDGGTSVDDDETIDDGPTGDVGTTDDTPSDDGPSDGGSGSDPVDEDGQTPPPGNTAPVAADDDVATPEDVAIEFDPRGNDSDADGDALTVVAVGPPAHGTAARDGSLVTYTPAPDFHGTDTFTYTLGDGRGGSDTATVDVTISPVNDAPVAAADSGYLVQAFASVLITDLLANDSDVDGDGLAVVLDASSPSFGRADQVDDTSVQYTHETSCTFTRWGTVCPQTDTISYRASDGSATSAATDVTVRINWAPIAYDDSMVVRSAYDEETFRFNVITGEVGSGCCSDEGESWSGRRDVDHNGDTIEYVGPRRLLSQPSWMTNFSCDSAGNCAITVSRCTGQPPYEFTYTVRDNRGGEDQAVMSFDTFQQCIR